MAAPKLRSNFEEPKPLKEKNLNAKLAGRLAAAQAGFEFAGDGCGADALRRRYGQATHRELAGDPAAPSPGRLEATPRPLDGLLRREQQFALRPGTPEVIVRACRKAIVACAVPHGAVNVSAASAGRLGRAGDALVAPIFVSIEYLRQGGIERRQGRVSCFLPRKGQLSRCGDHASVCEDEAEA